MDDDDAFSFKELKGVPQGSNRDIQKLNELVLRDKRACGDLPIKQHLEHAAVGQLAHSRGRLAPFGRCFELSTNRHLPAPVRWNI